METLIEKIESYGWKLNPNRTTDLAFYQIRNGNTWDLVFYKSAREWRLTRNDAVVYRGQDAEPEEIVPRLNDIKNQVIWQ